MDPKKPFLKLIDVVHTSVENGTQSGGSYLQPFPRRYTPSKPHRTDSPEKVLDNFVDHCVGQGVLLVQQSPQEDGIGSGVRQPGDEDNRSAGMVVGDTMFSQHTAQDAGFP